MVWCGSKARQSGSTQIKLRINVMRWKETRRSDGYSNVLPHDTYHGHSHRHGDGGRVGTRLGRMQWQWRWKRDQMRWDGQRKSDSRGRSKMQIQRTHSAG